MAQHPRTLCEAFQRTAAEEPSAVALRTVGGAQTITWAEYARGVRRLAAGLSASGVQAAHTVALMMTNRPEFHLIDTATTHLGAIPFSIYNTCAPEQIAYLVQNSGSQLVITEAQFVSRIRAAGVAPERIVTVDRPVEGLASLELVEARGASSFDFEATWRAVQPDQVATLIYTSGTTGDPKGVELTHKNVLAQVALTTSTYRVQRGDRYASYLPSAHIADRVSSHYIQMVFGTQVTCVSDPRRIAAALPDVQPHIWFAVPRVWEKIKQALEAAFSEARGPKAVLLRRALELGRKRARARGQDLRLLEGLQLALLDPLVLAKVRAKLGFRELRWALSGAAPIAPETLEFFMALGISIAEVWGMSETSGGAIGNPLSRVKVGLVGLPLPGVELRVADDGELSVRGEIVMRGYRNDPARTAEVLDADGWLTTGDVVTVDEEGYVAIVDRKKELIINASGKNISPSNIENAIKAATPVVGVAVTIGDARPYITALIVLDADAAGALAAKRGLAEGSAQALANAPAVLAVVAAGIAQANAKLSRVEQIKRFRVLPAYWEPGSDELTPTLKVRRREVARKYSVEIEELYAATPGPCVHEVGNHAARANLAAEPAAAL